MTNNRPIKKLWELWIFIRWVSYNKKDLYPSYQDGCISLLRSNNIQEELDINDLQYLPEASIKKEQITKDGDILFCMSNGSKHLVGKNVKLSKLDKFSFWAFCSIYRASNKEYVPYIEKFLQSGIYKSFIISLSRWAGINNLRNSDLENLEIPLPALAKQQEIVTYLDQIFAETKQLKTEYETKLSQLKEIKSSILQSAFEGKLI